MKIPICEICKTSHPGKRVVEITIIGDKIAPGWHHEKITIRDKDGEIIHGVEDCCLLVHDGSTTANDGPDKAGELEN